MSNIFIWLCFLIAQYVFSIMQRFYWRVSGVSRRLGERKTSNYESSAQVFTVRARCSHYVAYGPRRSHFIATHSRFDHPNCIFAREVTLYSITADDALFVRTTSDIDAMDSRVHPFINLAQFEYAKELIVLPIKHFHRLADEIGDPDIPVICLASIGRCGSTLLTQMMERVPGVLAISEPYPMVNIKFMEYSGEITDSVTTKSLVKSTMRFICKPRPEKLSFYFVKQSMGSEFIEQVATSIPGVKQMFMYRAKVINYLKSYHKIHMHFFGAFYKTKEFCVANGIFPRVVKKALDSMFIFSQVTVTWMRKTDEVSYNFSIDEMFLLRVHRMCEVYIDARNSCEIAGLRYEDLVTDPQRTCEALVEYCGLPSSLVELGPLALKTDSQQNAYWANKTKAVDYNELKMKSLYDICEQFNMPDISSEWCLPGTISCTS